MAKSTWSVRRFSSVLNIAVPLLLPIVLPAAEPMIAYGLTNVPIGNAYLSGDPYYGTSFLAAAI